MLPTNQQAQMENRSDAHCRAFSFNVLCVSPPFFLLKTVDLQSPSVTLQPALVRSGTTVPLNPLGRPTPLHARQMPPSNGAHVRTPGGTNRPPPSALMAHPPLLLLPRPGVFLLEGIGGCSNREPPREPARTK